MAKGQCDHREEYGKCRLLYGYGEGDNCLYPLSRMGRCPVVRIERQVRDVFDGIQRQPPATTDRRSVFGKIFETLAGFNGRLVEARKIRALKEAGQCNDID